MAGKNYYDVTDWHVGNPYTDIGEVITSYAGADWTKNTKLKSKKWLTTDADGEETKTVATAISAEMTVANDGSVTVKYTPATVKNQANK